MFVRTYNISMWVYLHTFWVAVDAVMGGQILEYEAKTILNKGKAEGRAEGRAESLYSLVSDKIITPSVAAERLEITIPELKANMLKAGYTYPTE